MSDDQICMDMASLHIISCDLRVTTGPVVMLIAAQMHGTAALSDGSRVEYGTDGRYVSDIPVDASTAVRTAAIVTDKTTVVPEHVERLIALTQPDGPSAWDLSQRWGRELIAYGPLAETLDISGPDFLRLSLGADPSKSFMVDPDLTDPIRI